jgi:hypothetical protein
MVISFGIGAHNIIHKEDVWKEVIILAKSGYRSDRKYKILNQPSIFMATGWKPNIEIWQFLNL